MVYFTAIYMIESKKDQSKQDNALKRVAVIAWFLQLIKVIDIMPDRDEEYQVCFVFIMSIRFLQNIKLPFTNGT